MKMINILLIGNYHIFRDLLLIKLFYSFDKSYNNPKIREKNKNLETKNIAVSGQKVPKEVIDKKKRRKITKRKKGPTEVELR